MPSTLWSPGGESRSEIPPLRDLRPQREDSEMDITPMIDITFLLLIFFLVASKMDQSTEVDLPPAQFGTAVATRNAVTVTLDVAGKGEPASVYAGDGVDPASRIDATDLEELEQRLEEYVTAALSEDARRSLVLIKAAGAVKHRDVARVARVVSRVAEIQGLHVAVLEGQ